MIVLPSEQQEDRQGKSEQDGDVAKAKERPVVVPSPPDVVAEERLLQRTLPDAHLTAVQEAGRKARHGRYEVRTVWTLSSAALNAYAGSSGTVGKPWPGLAQVSRIQRVTCERDRKTGRWERRTELAYSITSMPTERADARGILNRWRAHWHIEARHWVRDVTFGEDASQIHTGQVPESFSVVRNTAATLLGLAGFTSIAEGIRELQMWPLGVLALFDGLSNRLKIAHEEARRLPARQLRPPPQALAVGQPSISACAKARDPA